MLSQLEQAHLLLSSCFIESGHNFRAHDLEHNRLTTLLVTFIESFTLPNAFVIVMKRLEGELFPTLLSFSSYTEEDAQNYIRQLVDAVEFLHSKNIIHRDISPENLLLKSKADKSLALCGFSMATEASGTKAFDGLVGTPAIQPPELASRESFTKAVDMWSVGVIAYALLSGKVPFHDENVMRLNISIRNADYSFPDADFKGVSPEAKKFVKGLIVLDPKARYAPAQAKADPWLKAPKKTPLPSFYANLKHSVETNAWNC